MIHKALNGDIIMKGDVFIISDISIPRQHKDIALRSLSATFKNEIIPLLGLDLPKVVDVIQTSIPIIEIKDRNMDMNFTLANNELLHVEYESSEPSLEDQVRYGHYDLELFKERQQKINRVIVYTAGVKGNHSPINANAISQTQKVIHLDRDYDGDKILQEIQHKIDRGDSLTNLDKLHIILLPMMSVSDQSRSQRAWEVTTTVNRLPDKDLGYYLIGAMMGTNYSWIVEPEKEKILGVLLMAQPFQDFYQSFVDKGKEEGIKEGLQDAICRILNRRFGDKSLELQLAVRNITDKFALDTIIEELTETRTLKSALHAINSGRAKMTKQ